MIRSIFAVLAGIFDAIFVAFFIRTLVHLVHPPPADMNWGDADELKMHFATAPFTAHLCIAIAGAIGPLVGSFLAARIARRAFLAHGVMVGLFFLAAVVDNLRSFPHPAWLMVVGVVAPLAMSWLGSALADWTVSRPPAGPQPQDMREKNMAC